MAVSKPRGAVWTGGGEQGNTARKGGPPRPLTSEAYVVAFTGHRPRKLQSEAIPTIRRALADIVGRVLRKYPNAVFLSGMALGVDQWAAEAVLAARDAGARCRLVAVLPFEGQQDRWPRPDRERYLSILERADLVIPLVMGMPPRSPAHARRLLLARNRWMVKAARAVIAVWDGSPGGTAYTVRFALKSGRVVMRFDPRHPDRGWQRLR